jgi:hypothetical protein
VLAVAWSAPATSGAAAVTAYRVFLDDVLVATTSTVTVLVKNPGPGSHTVEVAAVSAAGEGGRADGTIALGQLSAPRTVKAVTGAAGGSLKAGVRWKPPGSAGGLEVRAYQVAVVEKGVGRVSRKKVAASRRSLLLTLDRGRYAFRVRARTSDGWGPWSKPTGFVRPR